MNCIKNNFRTENSWKFNVIKPKIIKNSNHRFSKLHIYKKNKKNKHLNYFKTSIKSKNKWKDKI
jgi:hypothetical protein